MNWISVKGCLPPYGFKVIVFVKEPSGSGWQAMAERTMTDRHGEHWSLHGLASNKVTHWMFLPEPPTETI